MQIPMNNLPIIDVSPLTKGQRNKSNVARELQDACNHHGFFYISGHGIDLQLQQRLESQSKAFFSRDIEYKMKIKMALGGRAWRGYFPIGNEVTSGKADLKEGLYFGLELDSKNRKVLEGLPMHGPNLFPRDMPDFRVTVLEYIHAMKRLGHQLMVGLSLSLGLKQDYFENHYTKDPLCLFRIFHYPSISSKLSDIQWGVGEHTDYGLLTILKQDNVGGLQIKANGLWIDAPVVPDTFICNIGDMLDRLTGGYYRSTPHRVLNKSGRGRYSFPFFFDPDFNAEINPIPSSVIQRRKDDKADRWDRSSVHDFKGTYGDYILNKVAKVFPDLKQKV